MRLVVAAPVWRHTAFLPLSRQLPPSITTTAGPPGPLVGAAPCLHVPLMGEGPRSRGRGTQRWGQSTRWRSAGARQPLGSSRQRVPARRPRIPLPPLPQHPRLSSALRAAAAGVALQPQGWHPLPWRCRLPLGHSPLQALAAQRLKSRREDEAVRLGRLQSRRWRQCVPKRAE